MLNFSNEIALWSTSPFFKQEINFKQFFSLKLLKKYVHKNFRYLNVEISAN
jgi:hypothetical protein